MKENENPTIYNVKKSNQRRDEKFYNNLIANDAISRFSFDPKGVNTLDVSSIPTPTERSIHLSLKSIDEGRKNKDYDPLSLLRISGMIREEKETEGSMSINTTGNKGTMELPSIFQQCYFIPFQEEELDTKSNLTSSSKTKLNRDPFEPEEIFDIIRNIQDPEHPLTLEQLNVVNLDHISVVDIPFYEKDSDEFSSVDVRFT